MCSKANKCRRGCVCFITTPHERRDVNDKGNYLKGRQANNGFLVTYAFRVIETKEYENLNVHDRGYTVDSAYTDTVVGT
jgi:hypothetical protein